MSSIEPQVSSSISSSTTDDKSLPNTSSNARTSSTIKAPDLKNNNDDERMVVDGDEASELGAAPGSVHQTMAGAASTSAIYSGGVIGHAGMLASAVSALSSHSAGLVPPPPPPLSMSPNSGGPINNPSKSIINPTNNNSPTSPSANNGNTPNNTNTNNNNAKSISGHKKTILSAAETLELAIFNELVCHGILQAYGGSTQTQQANNAGSSGSGTKVAKTLAALLLRSGNFNNPTTASSSTSVPANASPAITKRMSLSGLSKSSREMLNTSITINCNNNNSFNNNTFNNNGFNNNNANNNNVLNSSSTPSSSPATSASASFPWLQVKNIPDWLGISNTVLEESNEMVKKFFSQEVSHLLKWNFNVFMWSPSALYGISLAIMIDFHVPRVLAMPSITNLFTFIVDVERHYLDNPYHSFKHGVDVLQFMYYLLADYGVTAFLRAQDVTACLLAALCHDVGHPGLNNSYQVNAKSLLATRYNNISVLENYSVDLTLSLCRQHELFPPHQAADLEASIRAAILATDMAHHFNLLKSFAIFADSFKARNKHIPMPPAYSFSHYYQSSTWATNMANLNNSNNSNSNTNNTNNNTNNTQATLSGPFYIISKAQRQLFINVLLHSCDISNPCRDWQLCKKWSDLVMEEFFEQGDLERSQNLPLTPNMDRNNRGVQATGAISFHDYVVLPFFQVMAKMVPRVHLIILESLNRNREIWARIAASAEAEEALSKHINTTMNSSSVSVNTNIVNTNIVNTANVNVVPLTPSGYSNAATVGSSTFGPPLPPSSIPLNSPMNNNNTSNITNEENMENEEQISALTTDYHFKRRGSFQALSSPATSVNVTTTTNNNNNTNHNTNSSLIEDNYDDGSPFEEFPSLQGDEEEEEEGEGVESLNNSIYNFNTNNEGGSKNSAFFGPKRTSVTGAGGNNRKSVTGTTTSLVYGNNNNNNNNGSSPFFGVKKRASSGTNSTTQSNNLPSATTTTTTTQKQLFLNKNNSNDLLNATPTPSPPPFAQPKNININTNPNGATAASAIKINNSTTPAAAQMSRRLSFAAGVITIPEDFLISLNRKLSIANIAAVESGGGGNNESQNSSRRSSNHELLSSYNHHHHSNHPQSQEEISSNSSRPLAHTFNNNNKTTNTTTKERSSSGTSSSSSSDSMNSERNASGSVYNLLDNSTNSMLLEESDDNNSVNNKDKDSINNSINNKDNKDSSSVQNQTTTNSTNHLNDHSTNASVLLLNDSSDQQQQQQQRDNTPGSPRNTRLIRMTMRAGGSAPLLMNDHINNGSTTTNSNSTNSLKDAANNINVNNNINNTVYPHPLKINNTKSPTSTNSNNTNNNTNNNNLMTSSTSAALMMVEDHLTKSSGLFLTLTQIAANIESSVNGTSVIEGSDATDSPAPFNNKIRSSSDSVPANATNNTASSLASNTTSTSSNSRKFSKRHSFF